MKLEDTSQKSESAEEAVPAKPKWTPRGSTEDAAAGRLRFPLRGQAGKKDLTGKRFGRLLVIAESGRTKNQKITWRCICDCTNETIVIGADMVCGKQVSCGCQRNEASVVNGKKAIKHGLSFTSIASTRKGMIQRCYNPDSPSFRHYGGRGIQVCQGLRDSPAKMLELLGPRPDGMSIDRSNNDGHYSCGGCEQCSGNGWVMNVRWATSLQQGRNTRVNRHVEINGETHCVSEWVEKTGVSKTTILGRLKRGVTGMKLLAPSRGRPRK